MKTAFYVLIGLAVVALGFEIILLMQTNKLITAQAKSDKKTTTLNDFMDAIVAQAPTVSPETPKEDEGQPVKKTETARKPAAKPTPKRGRKPAPKREPAKS